MRSSTLPSLPLFPVPVVVVLLAGLVPHGAGAALADLDPGVRDEVARRCLPMQYREGANAYRNCVTEGVAAREGSVGHADGLDALSIDDRYAIRQACPGANDTRCIASQIAALESAPDPFLGELDEGERHALRRECSAVQGRDGVAAYRRCLDGALAALETLPPAALGSLSLLERSALASRCATDDGPATDYRRCLLEGSGEESNAVTGAVTGAVAESDAGTATEPVAAPDTEATGVAADGDGPTVRRLVLPAAALPDEDASSSSRDRAPVVTAQQAGGEDAVDAADPEADTEVVTDADTTPVDVRARAVDARERLAATVAGLDGTERIVLGVALALPLLLVGIWAATRGRTGRRRVATDPGPPIRNADLVGRVSPPPEHGRGSDLRHDDLRFDDTANEDFLGDLEYGGRSPAASDRADAPPARTSAPPIRTEAAVVDLDATEDTGFADGPFDDERGADDRPAEARAVSRDAVPPSVRDGDADGESASAPFVPRSDLGRRLLAGDVPLARQHAIEFLIYWMAYGDERYEEATREALLRGDGDDGDPHDLIKRRVLEEDTLAFADVVRWLQGGTHELQRVQIIDLLMVLLISENAMTPAQNTLLHFLADAFGLGARTLGERHEQAFGTPMPALARTDLAAWWNRVEPGVPIRWDARAIAGLDEDEQFRIRLGLPLEGEVGENDIVEGFRRAARRCHPHRFDELGERERALAERQFAKFEEARDRLLGMPL